MAVKDRNVLPAAVVASDKQAISLATATGQTDAVAYKWTPGYDFQVTRVRSYCRVKAGTITYAVKVGTRTVLTAGVFTTATEVAGTLSTTLANIQGSSTEAVSLEFTSDGSGALTNGFVIIELRPRHMNGES